MSNQPYDYTVDYFAVLGIHYDASEEQVKKAYRRMARRYHPDVSKIHDAKQKFQEISEAYEILRKHRLAYCRQYSAYQEDQQRRQSAQFSYQGSQAKKRPQDFYANSDRANTSSSFQQRDASANRQKKQPSQDWEFESRYAKSGFHQPIDGKDRWIEYPLTLRYAIRQLRIGSFYVPGLKVRMKFSRQAFEGKTFRIAGKGYKGLFGGQDGDFLVKFQIRIDEERFEVRGGDIYAKYFIAPHLLQAGRTVYLDTPAGRVDLYLPENFESQPCFKVEKMGLPEEPGLPAGDLYIELLPRTEEMNAQTGFSPKSAYQNTNVTTKAQKVHSHSMS